MTSPLLQIQNLSKSFGHFVAVNDVSLTLKQGELTALIGPNGAGKTTFYNMVSGRMTPSQGAVYFRGEDIIGLPPHRISRLGISRSFQISNVFDDFTVLENVQVALVAVHNKGLNLWRVSADDKELEAQGMALLARLGLKPLARSRAAILSYGDKRQLELAKTTTILFTDQNIRFALKHASRAYIIKKGRIRHHANTEEFHSDPSKLEQYLSL